MFFLIFLIDISPTRGYVAIVVATAWKVFEPQIVLAIYKYYAKH